QFPGAVGTAGWAVSPGLHYEYWRLAGGRLTPTDPLFAILDRPLGRRDLSLEQMRATSAAGTIEPPPGLEKSAAPSARSALGYFGSAPGSARPVPGADARDFGGGNHRAAARAVEVGGSLTR